MSPSAVRPPRVPSWVPWLGHAIQFGRNPVRFVSECRERYGDVFTVQLPGGPRTLLLDPHDYPAYFKEKRLVFGAVGVEVGERTFGYDTNRVRGFDLERFVHASGRLLQGTHLPPLSERIHELLAARLATHEGTRHDALLHWIHEHVFAAGTEALCGEGFYSPDVLRDYFTIDRYFPLLLAGVPVRLLPGCREARRRFASAVMEPHPRRAHVMQVRDEELARAGADREEVGLYNTAWIWASQVNTLNAAFWTLLFVLDDRKARRIIEREVDEVCGSVPLMGSIYADVQLRALVNLDSAMTEALRLSSGPMATRRVSEDLELSTASGRVFRFERGEHVDLFPYLNHVDPEIFDDPLTFRHDRFLAAPKPPQFFKRGQKLAFPALLFGSGSSMCPGRFLARNEVKTIVALLLSHFELELLTRKLPSPDFTRMGLGVLPPACDVPLRISRR